MNVVGCLRIQARTEVASGATCRIAAIWKRFADSAHVNVTYSKLLLQHLFDPNRSGGLLGFAEIGRFQTTRFRSILIFFSSVKVEENLNRDLRGDHSATADARLLGSARY